MKNININTNTSGDENTYIQQKELKLDISKALEDSGNVQLKHIDDNVSNAAEVIDWIRETLYIDGNGNKSEVPTDNWAITYTEVSTGYTVYVNQLFSVKDPRCNVVIENIQEPSVEYDLSTVNPEDIKVERDHYMIEWPYYPNRHAQQK